MRTWAVQLPMRRRSNVLHLHHLPQRPHCACSRARDGWIDLPTRLRQPAQQLMGSEAHTNLVETTGAVVVEASGGASG